MLNSYIKGLFIFLILVFPLGAVAQDTQSDVEALKKQIEEMQKQNQEMMKKIQEQNAKQIYDLQLQISELEQKKSVTESTSGKTVVIDEESLNKKIEKSVNDNLVSRTKDWFNFSFSNDFPNYYRTRARFINNGTFLSAANAKDEVFFVDSRLLVSPQITMGENLHLRAQFDIAKNIIWGGLGDQLISDKVYNAPSPGDSFKGAVLRDVTDTQTGNIISPTENVDLVDIRSLYMVARIEYGEFWVGRFPFDWGLGIFNNAGSMPDQDLGSIVDRLEFDTAPLSLLDERFENLLFAFIVDRLSEGLSIGNFDEGDGWDVGLALLYEDPKLTLGAYMFGIFQNNFSISEGITANLDPGINSSLFGSYVYDEMRFSFEFQNIFGEINNISEPLNEILGSESINISAENISFVARAEYHPPFSSIYDAAIEFGFAKGDDARTPDDLEGNLLYFNNAYVIDSLMYKHIVPSVYALEGSVINSYYLRGWSTFKLNDSLYLTPQAIIGFVEEENALALNLFEPLPAVDSYLGTEIEATLTWKLRDNLWFDLIGSLVFAGGGLKDLMSQRAFIEGAVDSLDDANPPDYPYAITGRFIFTFDDIVDRWRGSSTTKKRAWFNEINL